MYIFKFEYPGLIPVLEDYDLTKFDREGLKWGQPIRDILFAIETQITEAAVALELYEENFYKYEMHTAALRKGLDFSEVPPINYITARFKICAKEFIYSIDMISKHINTLCAIPDIPKRVKNSKEDFKKHFPQLRGMRDTFQHQEERVIGKAKNKNIEFKPINISGIEAPYGGLHIGSSFRNGIVGTTLEDGVYVEIGINIDNLVLIKNIFQEILYSFKWHGPARTSF